MRSHAHILAWLIKQLGASKCFDMPFSISLFVGRLLLAAILAWICETYVVVHVHSLDEYPDSRIRNQWQLLYRTGAWYQRLPNCGQWTGSHRDQSFIRDMNNWFDQVTSRYHFQRFFSLFWLRILYQAYRPACVSGWSSLNGTGVSIEWEMVHQLFCYRGMASWYVVTNNHWFYWSQAHKTQERAFHYFIYLFYSL